MSSGYADWLVWRLCSRVLRGSYVFGTCFFVLFFGFFLLGEGVGKKGKGKEKGGTGKHRESPFLRCDVDVMLM